MPVAWLSCELLASGPPDAGCDGCRPDPAVRCALCSVVTVTGTAITPSMLPGSGTSCAKSCASAVALKTADGFSRTSSSADASILTQGGASAGAELPVPPESSGLVSAICSSPGGGMRTVGSCFSPERVLSVLSSPATHGASASPSTSPSGEARSAAASMPLLASGARLAERSCSDSIFMLSCEARPGLGPRTSPRWSWPLSPLCPAADKTPPQKLVCWAPSMLKLSASLDTYVSDTVLGTSPWDGDTLPSRLGDSAEDASSASSASKPAAGLPGPVSVLVPDSLLGSVEVLSTEVWSLLWLEEDGPSLPLGGLGGPGVATWEQVLGVFASTPPHSFCSASASGSAVADGCTAAEDISASAVHGGAKGASPAPSAAGASGDWAACDAAPSGGAQAAPILEKANEGDPVEWLGAVAAAMEEGEPSAPALSGRTSSSSVATEPLLRCFLRASWACLRSWNTRRTIRHWRAAGACTQKLSEDMLCISARQWALDAMNSLGRAMLTSFSAFLRCLAVSFCCSCAAGLSSGLSMLALPLFWGPFPFGFLCPTALCSIAHALQIENTSHYIYGLQPGSG